MKKNLFKFIILPMIILSMSLFGMSSLLYADESYNIGDTGPAGGIIFYVNGNNYLEAAPVDTQNQFTFSNVITSMVGTSTAIGTGQANTNAIIAQAGHTFGAAFVCDNHTLNGYTDWFLPSEDELALMYANRGIIGCFANDYYWSSTDTGPLFARAIDFSTGVHWYSRKDVNHHVRPIRAFTIAGEEEEPAWVRTMPMTCWQVWINDDNNFQFIFWYPYMDENIVRIYDMEGNIVFETDLPVHDPNLIVDLPDGMYMVKTFHGLVPLQEFMIGKPGPEM